MKTKLTLVALSLIASSAFAQVASTKHNLSSTGTGSNTTATTTQICVFCHTPHGADTSAPVPLWNRTVPTTTYATYAAVNSNTMESEVLAVGSVSLACLSCHDGTQSMDSVLNAPGRGGIDTTATTFAGGGKTLSTSYANLVKGADTGVSNDHPIGVMYCGGGLTGTGTSVTGTCNDTGFVGGNAVGGGISTKTGGNGEQMFWLDTSSGTTNKRDKTDLVFFTRTFSGGVKAPSVECATCHDPHVAEKSGDGVMFMRVAVSGSTICLTCHDK